MNRDGGWWFVGCLAMKVVWYFIASVVVAFLAKILVHPEIGLARLSLALLLAKLFIDFRILGKNPFIRRFNDGKKEDKEIRNGKKSRHSRRRSSRSDVRDLPSKG